jgi:glycerate dehydrogenase
VKLDRETLAALPKLKYVSLLATGYNNVDVAAAGEFGITVSNIPAYSTESVAQTTFALLLELAMHAGIHDASVKGGEWLTCPDFSYCRTPLLELHGLTLGIIGYGSIGRAVARIGAAFGMNIIVYTPRIPLGTDDVPVQFVSREELFRVADVVSLHCPQTPENGAIVNAALLGTMKRGALLLNLARGGLVNESDLASALRGGVIAGAGLDVVSQEPMLPSNPLLTAPNCIFTPHIAWATLAARKRLMATVTANVAAYLTGAPINVVNQQFLV